MSSSAFTTIGSIAGSTAALTKDIIEGNISLVGNVGYDSVEVLLHAILYPAGGALMALVFRIVYDEWTFRRTRKRKNKSE